jgi:hypothetical protein
VASAAKNPRFDFFVLTNLSKPGPTPENVRILPMEFSELSHRLSEVVGFPLGKFAYHKLCDFKPFYGLVFHDLLQSYRYWGYCDVDLFFGDLRPLMEMAESENFDFISPFDYTVGHCTLVRNEARVNQIALKMPDLKNRCLEPGITFMDEGGISETAVRAGGFSFGVVENLTEEWKKPNPFLGATARPDGSIAGVQGWFLLHYTDGRVLLYDRNLQVHEVLYFHFMAMKTARYWRNLAKCDREQFSFTSYGIVPGLLDPYSMLGNRFQARCWASQFPSYVYRRVRNCIPDSIVRRIKKARRKDN